RARRADEGPHRPARARGGSPGGSDRTGRQSGCPQPRPGPPSPSAAPGALPNHPAISHGWMDLWKGRRSARATPPPPPPARGAGCGTRCPRRSKARAEIRTSRRPPPARGRRAAAAPASARAADGGRSAPEPVQERSFAQVPAGEVDENVLERRVVGGEPGEAQRLHAREDGGQRDV